MIENFEALRQFADANITVTAHTSYHMDRGPKNGRDSPAYHIPGANYRPHPAGYGTYSFVGDMPESAGINLPEISSTNGEKLLVLKYPQYSFNGDIRDPNRISTLGIESVVAVNLSTPITEHYTDPVEQEYEEHPPRRFWHRNDPIPIVRTRQVDIPRARTIGHLPYLDANGNRITRFSARIPEVRNGNNKDGEGRRLRASGGGVQRDGRISLSYVAAERHGQEIIDMYMDDPANVRNMQIAILSRFTTGPLILSDLIPTFEETDVSQSHMRNVDFIPIVVFDNRDENEPDISLHALRNYRFPDAIKF